MKPEYLTLINGRSVRIQFSGNALIEFTELTGKETKDLAAGKVDMKTFRTLAWCCAVEGEAVDGKELMFDEIELFRLVNMDFITKFSEILADQSTTGAQKKKPPRFPLIHFRGMR
jgi:hypothetical protein